MHAAGTSALLGALPPRNNKHYSTLTKSADIAILIKAIKAYPYTVMRCAMLFSVYTFARPGEIRAAELSEINGDVWDIPAEKMKMKCRHIVHLFSRQSRSPYHWFHKRTNRSFFGAFID